MQTPMASMGGSPYGGGPGGQRTPMDPYEDEARYQTQQGYPEGAPYGGDGFGGPGTAGFGGPGMSGPPGGGEFGMDTMGMGDTGMDTIGYDGMNTAVAVKKIDPQTGLAPRRVTDCVCGIIFIFYVIGMFIVVHFADGDPKRLTHSFDYNARLCGVDDEVRTKPYIFWCRINKPGEPLTQEPSDLNTQNPVCVEECPTATDMVQGTKFISCLQRAWSVDGTYLPGGQFGNNYTWYLSSQQAVINTSGYDTKAYAGRYCMPTNPTLRNIVEDPVSGPLPPSVRLKQSFGSFQDPWAVLFLCTVVSVIASGCYLYLLRHCARWLVLGFLWVATLIFLLSSITFLLAIPTFFAEWPWYQNSNPLYSHFPRVVAATASTIYGVIFLIICLGFFAMDSHIHATFNWIGELVDCAYSALDAMPSMYIPPILEALWKYFIMWILCYNFMFLVSVGWKDRYRIQINGVNYEGPSAKFYFDYWELFGIAYYIVGAIWIMEIPNAMGQFLISYSTVSWYFMPKEGKRKMAVPHLPPLHALRFALSSNLGSVLLGAFVVPYGRPFRAFWFFQDNMPKAGEGNCVANCIGNICGCFFKCLNACCVDAALCGEKGYLKIYTKQAYTDIVIRSNHFMQAALKSYNILTFHPPSQRFTGKLGIITVVGVTSLGIFCAALTYIMVLAIPAFSDPTSKYYIYDPMMVAFMAFCLGGAITSGFMMLIDHTADVLLYCYAWNKRLNRGTVDKFVPEDLRDIVGYEDRAMDEYAYYGRAQPNMYLANFMSTNAGPAHPSIPRPAPLL